MPQFADQYINKVYIKSTKKTSAAHFRSEINKEKLSGQQINN